METMTQRRVSASTVSGGKPPGAVSSVFDAGRQARPTVNRTAIDPNAITIRRGEPLPPQRAGLAGDRYGELAKRMQPGDCVHLSAGQANALASKMRSLGIKQATRRIDANTVGVWRLG